MAELSGLVRSANTALEAGDHHGAAPMAAAVEEMATALGLELRGDGDDVPVDVAALVARREKARSAGDFAGADAIRGQIGGLGWTVEDTPQGPRIHRKSPRDTVDPGW